MTPPLWTQQETDRLQQLRDEGLSAREIGLRLGRTQRAVEARAKLLKLKLSNYIPTPPGPKPNPKKARDRLYRQARKLLQDIPRAGPTTLPPLPSLQEPLHIIQQT